VRTALAGGRLSAEPTDRRRGLRRRRRASAGAVGDADADADDADAGAGAPAGTIFVARVAAAEPEAAVAEAAAPPLPRRRRVNRLGELLFPRSLLPSFPTPVDLCSRRRDDGHFHIFLPPVPPTPPLPPIRRRPSGLSASAAPSASSPMLPLPLSAASPRRRTFASKLVTSTCLMCSGETCTACDRRRSSPIAPATSGLLLRRRCPFCSLGVWLRAAKERRRGRGERYIGESAIFFVSGWSGAASRSLSSSRRNISLFKPKMGVGKIHPWRIP